MLLLKNRFDRIMTMKKLCAITLALILPALFFGCAVPTKNHKRVAYVPKPQSAPSQPEPKPASRPTYQPRPTRNIFTGEIITEVEKEKLDGRKENSLKLAKILADP